VDIYSIIGSGYANAKLNLGAASGKYVNVDPKSYEGTWKGKYSDNKAFTIGISNVNGFRAKARYQSGSEVKYQEVLIKNDSFRIGDSKFTLKSGVVAEVKTVVTSPIDGSTVLNTAYARRG
jgi:hypothetical protein